MKCRIIARAYTTAKRIGPREKKIKLSSAQVAAKLNAAFNKKQQENSQQGSGNNEQTKKPIIGFDGKLPAYKDWGHGDSVNVMLISDVTIIYPDPLDSSATEEQKQQYATALEAAKEKFQKSMIPISNVATSIEAYQKDRINLAVKKSEYHEAKNKINLYYGKLFSSSERGSTDASLQNQWQKELCNAGFDYYDTHLSILVITDYKIDTMLNLQDKDNSDEDNGIYAYILNSKHVRTSTFPDMTEVFLSKDKEEVIKLNIPKTYIRVVARPHHDEYGHLITFDMSRVAISS